MSSLFECNIVVLVWRVYIIYMDFDNRICLQLQDVFFVTSVNRVI